MAEVFESYEEEFTTCIAQIQRHIRFMENLSDGTLDEDTVKDAKEEIRAAQSHIQRLKMQSRSIIDSALKKELKKRVRVHEKSLSAQRKALQKLATRVERNAISSSSGGPSSMEVTGSSSRLLRLQQQSRATSSKLENARRIAMETERSAESSLNELYEQREVLLASRKKAQDTQDVMGQARRILGRMGRRNVINNILWYLMVVIAVILVAIFLYIFLFR